MNTSDNHALGDFLRARRQRLDPATFGFPAGRRRTPGLRREEVAQLASISPTWYTWLEQGRGGAPSREVLERIARGLRLTTPEREHLFILAFGHPPQTRLTVTDDMTPRLQRVLDAFTIPAIIRTASWDVIAWNAPAAGADRLQPTAAGGAQRAAPPVYPAGGPLHSGGLAEGGAAYRQRLPRRRHADGRHERN